ncbi:hypothetical protein KFE25_000060 [Diacronema lutheri]|uniref:Peptidylprolyl isomerase n=2 Tax=Diacronema lutheri TaxID=2081491 RepID=A0A8J5XLK0_DIALT|nr:hypothetical protein KFE25_000060 [Diacronema lutheri]
MGRSGWRSASVVVLLLGAAVAQDGCDDDDASCSDWAASGECDKNRAFMRSACARSCNSCPPPIDESLTELGDERVIMDVAGYGTITLGFYPNAAPVTVKHILQLFRLGCYDTNHIFRVDRGFVAQVQSIYQGAVIKELSPECVAEAAKTVPGEFTPVRHVKGILSMGRMADPDSGGSSFSMLLGKAPHLDQQYTVFGRVLDGIGVLEALEHVETKREGIFVMPKERIEIVSAVVVDKDARTEL